MTHITLAHGNGGHYMRQLIEEVFATRLTNPVLDSQLDAIQLPEMEGELMMSVDGFTVQPLEFPGGNIGSLAIHGTVNDLAVSGAQPKYLSLSVIIEEGLELQVLERVVNSMAVAAEEAGVMIVCGDTKVVPKGQGSGIYITTTGVGSRISPSQLGLKLIKPGDQILLSGSVGDHGTAVMLAREQFGLKGDILSDSDNVIALCHSLMDFPGLRFMRDPTRGGLATVLYEIHLATNYGLRIFEQSIPIKEQVQSVCEILGYDPLYLACEGRVVAIVDVNEAQIALEKWKKLPQGEGAAIIGEISDEISRVVLETHIGGQRVLEELEDDPLPRIC